MRFIVLCILCLSAVPDGIERGFAPSVSIHTSANILLKNEIMKIFEKNLTNVCTFKFLHYLCNPVR